MVFASYTRIGVLRGPHLKDQVGPILWGILAPSEMKWKLLSRIWLFVTP